MTHVGLNPSSSRPAARLALLALVGLAGPAVLAPLLFPAPHMAAWAAAAGVYAAGAGLAVRGMHRGYPHAVPGLCNAVTLLRLVLASVLVAPLGGHGAGPWVVPAVAVAGLALDGVDGWLARRAGLVSAFGARFDMEVDSALALILALNAFVATAAGPLVLLLGLPRYAFAAAAWAAPWLAAPLPDRFGRKAVCVVQIAALIALQLPGLPAPLAPALAGGAALALAWSFGRDILWLWRVRG